MISPINIHKQNEQLDLREGNYLIDFVGGWLIEPNDFKILLSQNNTSDLVAINEIKWKAQTLEFGTKCKRFFEFKISQSGIYQLNFENSERVEIKRFSNLLFAIFFPKLIDNRKIMIYIYRKF
jgi:hypothetical protein